MVPQVRIERTQTRFFKPALYRWSYRGTNNYGHPVKSGRWSERFFDSGLA